MKKIIFICAILLYSFLYSQDFKKIKATIDSSKIEIGNLQDEYYELSRQSEILIYMDKNDHKYSYYSKIKYDSLTKTKVSDSIVLIKSILKISKGNNEFYIMKMSNLIQQNERFYKYKANRLLSMESYDRFLHNYRKEDFKALTSFSYCGKSDCIYEYQFAKFSKLNSEKQLADVLYSMRIDRMGAIYEQFYDKDFPLDEKTFMTKFTKHSVLLMKGVKYSRGHGSPSKEFDTKDLEYEIEYFKKNITEKQKATSGFYDKKELIFKLRAEGGIGIAKNYDTANRPYYRLLFNYDMKRWEFKINPTTGDIEKIEFDLVYE